MAVAGTSQLFVDAPSICTHRESCLYVFEESSEEKSIHLCRGHAVLAARLSDVTESIIVGARFLTDSNTGDALKASH
jgi:hypothetical protein